MTLCRKLQRLPAALIKKKNSSWRHQERCLSELGKALPVTQDSIFFCWSLPEHKFDLYKRSLPNLIVRACEKESSLSYFWKDS